jgi:hypothetical protein
LALLNLRGLKYKTMGTLGRHKRRRRNTSEHECRNNTGRARIQEQDAGNSSLEASSEPQEEQQSAAKIEEAPTTTSTTGTTFSTKTSSILGPKNGATGDPPTKPAASKTPLLSTQEKVIAEFSEDELLGFLALLRQQNSKTASTNGSSTTTPNSSTTTETTECSSLPLHSNNQYINFEKFSEFTLDFNAFSYKVNELGRKTKRDSREAIRQAESRATKKMVSAIMDAGDDNQQRALALHRSLIDERISIREI